MRHCVTSGSTSGLIWETRNSPADYQLDSLSPEVYNALLAGHIQVRLHCQQQQQLQQQQQRRRRQQSRNER
jgi:hypothetical protein